MKRILLVASRLTTKSKEAALSPEASATIVQVLKIASTINVPFCQTACNTVIAFIQMGEAAGTNDRQWKTLLDLIQIHVNEISQFVEAISKNHPPDYFAVSDDLQAKIARESVQEFETKISQTKSKIDARLGTGKVKKRLAATVIQEEITECRLMIDTAHKQFTASKLNILISSVGALVPSKPSAPEETEYDIFGARPLRGQDIEVLEDVDMATVVQDSFWTNLVRVEVQNKVRIAKIYPSDGGKEKFEKDLEFFAKCRLPKVVQICGYNSRSQVPFLVFATASVLPIAERWCHIRDKIARLIMRGWTESDREAAKLFINDYRNLRTQMELATRYLFKLVDRRNVDHVFHIYAALRDAALDPNGKLMVAPLTENSTRIIGTWPSVLGERSDAINPARKSIYLNIWFHDLDQVIQTWHVGKESIACLYQRWPNQVLLGPPHYPTAGDLVIVDGFGDPQAVANVTAFTGPIRFYPPGQPTSQMHVYRCEIDGYCEGKRKSRMSPRISWFSDVDSNSIDIDALWRFCVRKRAEARDIFERWAYLALVTAVQYSIKPDEPAILSPSHSSGPSPNLYVYFSPQNEYIAARWSFQPEPPTEAEAAEEASLLSSFPCPKFSSKPEAWLTEYLHFEDVKKDDDDNLTLLRASRLPFDVKYVKKEGEDDEADKADKADKADEENEEEEDKEEEDD